jgi:hypothetical protein
MSDWFQRSVDLAAKARAALASPPTPAPEEPAPVEEAPAPAPEESAPVEEAPAPSPEESAPVEPAAPRRTRTRRLRAEPKA